MKKRTVVEEHSSLICIGLITAAVVRRLEGFRLKDVQFYYDLFSNWIESQKRRKAYDLQLVQIQRLLKNYVADEYIKEKKAKRGSSYELTSSGMVKILEKLMLRETLLHSDELLVIVYFVRVYGKNIEDLAINSNKRMSARDKAHLADLIDPKKLIARQIGILKEVIHDLDERMEKSEQLDRHAQKLKGESTPELTIIATLHKNHSYQLAHQKPFKEVWSELPPELLKTELSSGIKLRNEILFSKLKSHFLGQKKFLEEL